MHNTQGKSNTANYTVGTLLRENQTLQTIQLEPCLDIVNKTVYLQQQKYTSNTINQYSHRQI